MNAAEVEEWLVGWFRERASNAAGSREELVSTNYFDAGLIDSFGVIELIGDIEQTHGIEFSAEDFLDREFSTIRGLSALIAQRRSAKAVS